MSNAVDIPILVDGDQGFALNNAKYSGVQTKQRGMGIAGVVFEDKTCSQKQIHLLKLKEVKKLANIDYFLVKLEHVKKIK